MIKRKPDLEVESFRAWIPTKKEEEIAKEDKGVCIKLSDNTEIYLTGFNTVSRKEDNKVVFAYKFKHDTKQFLYWIDKEQDKDKLKLLDCVIKLNETFGYDLQDMEEQVKNIKNEMGTLEKISNNKLKGKRKK